MVLYIVSIFCFSCKVVSYAEIKRSERAGAVADAIGGFFRAGGINNIACVNNISPYFKRFKRIAEPGIENMIAIIILGIGFIHKILG